MKTALHPRVIDAQRMTDGVIITFDDGSFALYSSMLLYESLARAEHFPEDMYADDDPAPEQEQEQE